GGDTYTGPAPQTIALSWDKPRVKRVLERAGVATPRWRLCSTPEDVSGWDRFPAIVKPAYEHCSVGVTRLAVACSADELTERVGFVLGDLRQPALVEEFIDGREFHVGLWGDRVLHVLPAAEMDFSAFAEVRDRLCTFDSKFSPGSPAYELTRVSVPANLSPGQLADLERAVVGAFRAVGCRDYARMDVRLDGDTFHVVDVNPNPDISSDTSIAAAAAAAGMPHGDLASRIVMLAARRHPVFRAVARSARTARTLAPADDAV
ncbi:MAG: hypothetical protein FJ087_23760, partial [Deltaproteobacteria bacterium]|nr:hypothetical protein [Deltaproteobacteria bacterium]